MAAGGLIEQHLPDRVGHDAHSPSPGMYSSHQVEPVGGSLLAEVLGDHPLDVPTYHHQAVVPESLSGSAWAASAWHEDGTLEAMEDRSGRFRLAVQWHAEEAESADLFAALVSAAASGVGVALP